MTTIAHRLATVQGRISAACLRAGRAPASVRLLAVSKTFGLAAVREAFESGQTAFGENYIQEGVGKIQALKGLPLEWHCIGPIQSNKTKLVAEHFDWVHSVDRLKIAQRLSEQRPLKAPVLQVLIQVNVDQGPNKSGVTPAELPALAHAVAALPNLRLRGLMCIPEPSQDPGQARRPFDQVQGLFQRLCAEGLPLDTLSMGMSEDLELAIEAGSTLVRVGRALFGERVRIADSTEN